LLTKAYPHLLFTHFVMPKTGESFWSWKLPVTPGLRDWLAKSRMTDLVRDSSGLHKRVYDHEGNLVSDTIIPPRRPKPSQ
jgi:hypothetical protein